MAGKIKVVESTVERGQSVRKTFLALREMIVFGRLAPGSWIIEGDLARRLGVSRTPLRSALQWLEREGYILAVKSGPQARLTVAPLTEKDAREVYMIVGHMEGLAGRMASSLETSLRDPLTATLKQLNAEMRRATNSTESHPHEFFELDTKFHESIVVAVAGTHFLSIYNGKILVAVFEFQPGRTQTFISGTRGNHRNNRQGRRRRHRTSLTGELGTWC
jgi:DNA-binding GntR family transcriptional regulator